MTGHQPNQRRPMAPDRPSSTSISRRDFLRLVGILSAGGALSACAPVYASLGKNISETFAPSQEVDTQEIARLPYWQYQVLNRMTFGPRLEERLYAYQIGLENWIEEQLDYESIEDLETVLRLRQFSTIGMDAADLVDLSDKIFDEQDRRMVPDELRQATLLRQVYSRRQLFETLVEFWSDHFNISTDKGDCFFLKTVDDRQVIRRNALGKFSDLLYASAHSPAMLVYLDNQSNTKGTPNENYARELLELHTLSVQGGYTQQDVMELARCLTGWTVKERFWRGEFTFNTDIHDLGTKTVLGMEIRPAGQQEAESVIDMLASHPNTARFIAYKLAQRYIADDPPAELVDRGAKVFLDTNGDIKRVARTVLLDGTRYMQAKYKRPVNFVVSALRCLDARIVNSQAILDFLARMGQLHFSWPTPDGYPDYVEAWAGNLMPRWQFAIALASDELSGVIVPFDRITAESSGRSTQAQLDYLCSLILGRTLGDGTHARLLEALESTGSEVMDNTPLLISGLLASPAFQWR